MKLYRIDYRVPAHPAAATSSHTAWCASRAETKAKLKALLAHHKEFSVDQMGAVEVPVDRPGLLKWLNANTTHEPKAST